MYIQRNATCRSILIATLLVVAGCSSEGPRNSMAPLVPGQQSVRAETTDANAARIVLPFSPTNPTRIPDHARYFPVQFVYPTFLKATVIGFDVNASDGCRSALALAERTGNPALTHASNPS